MALTALGVYAVSFGARRITVVALKPIAAQLGGARSVPASAYYAVAFAVGILFNLGNAAIVRTLALRDNRFGRRALARAAS